LLVVSKPAAQTFTYAYDELGRLLAVVDPSGNAGVYSYDKVGNLLSISNTTSATVSIFTFTPNNWATGQNSTVTIYGDGFSATPSQNQVWFNTTPATVSKSTVAMITTSVPGGATTGLIKVTVTGVGTATSSANFTVN
jgi:YD repeat-containing protein